MEMQITSIALNMTSGGRADRTAVFSSSKASAFRITL